MDRRITPEQWVLHLEAAEQAGGPLSAYAREHGLNVQHLYAARQRQRRLAGSASRQCVGCTCSLLLSRQYRSSLRR